MHSKRLSELSWHSISSFVTSCAISLRCHPWTLRVGLIAAIYAAPHANIVPLQVPQELCDCPSPRLAMETTRRALCSNCAYRAATVISSPAITMIADFSSDVRELVTTSLQHWHIRPGLARCSNFQPASAPTLDGLLDGRPKHRDRQMQMRSTRATAGLAHQSFITFVPLLRCTTIPSLKLVATLFCPSRR